MTFLMISITKGQITGPYSPQNRPTGLHPIGPPLYKTLLLPAPHIPLPPPLPPQAQIFQQ